MCQFLRSVLYAIYRSYFYVDFCFCLFWDTYELFVHVAALIFMAVVVGLESLSSRRIFLSFFIFSLSYRFIFLCHPTNILSYPTILFLRLVYYAARAIFSSWQMQKNPYNNRLLAYSNPALLSLRTRGLQQSHPHQLAKGILSFLCMWWMLRFALVCRRIFFCPQVR